MTSRFIGAFGCCLQPLAQLVERLIETLGDTLESSETLLKPPRGDGCSIFEKQHERPVDAKTGFHLEHQTRTTCLENLSQNRYGMLMFILILMLMLMPMLVLMLTLMLALTDLELMLMN